MDIKVIASGSDGNCYRVSDSTTTILLDAGVSIKEIRKGCDFNLAGVEACFVTHSHSDHCKAVRDLVRSGIRTYMTAAEAQAADLSAVKILAGVEGCPAAPTPDKYKPYEIVNVGSFIVRPFRVEHDTPEPVGFFVMSRETGERLIYFTDTYYIRQRFVVPDYIIGEVNYDEETVKENLEAHRLDSERMKRLFSTHMGLKTFLGFLRANDMSRLKQVWICHMSNENGNAERIKEAVQRETGAEVYVC